MIELEIGRVLIFIGLSGLMAALIFSFIDCDKIKSGIPIRLEKKNRRAILIGAWNLLLSVVAVIAMSKNWFTILPLVILAQLWFGTVFDLMLNIRRFGWTWKSLIYTSDNEDDLNDALLDRVFNFLPYPLSGILQLTIKVAGLVFLLKII